MFSIPTPPRLCQCGCGQPTLPAKTTDIRRGEIEGVPAPYLPYHRYRIAQPHESPDEIEVPLPHNLRCLISRDDADLAEYKWYLGPRYVVRHGPPPNRDRLLLMHRIILERAIGRALLPGEECDHINGDRLNNRRDNLRLATRQQNVWNRALPVKTQSGYRGVRFDRRRRCWLASIQLDGKERCLGSFETAELAAKAYEHAAKQAHGEWFRPIE